jgi:hypothetical protein
LRSPREATCPSIASWSPRTLHVFFHLDLITEIVPSIGAASAPALVDVRIDAGRAVYLRARQDGEH